MTPDQLTQQSAVNGHAVDPPDQASSNRHRIVICMRKTNGQPLFCHKRPDMMKIYLTTSDSSLLSAVEAELPDSEVRSIGMAGANTSGEQGWYFIDWLLEETAGLEICRRLRATPATAGSHITMVLDDADRSAQRRALMAGADDYMPGPLTAESIAERMERYLGAGARSGGEQVHCGLSLNRESQQVRWQGKLIPLSPRELNLLAIFLEHPDKLLSRQQLVALSGKASRITDERTVDVWIGRLRRTLEAHGVPKFLRTVRSMGYVFDTPDRSADRLRAS